MNICLPSKLKTIFSSSDMTFYTLIDDWLSKIHSHLVKCSNKTPIASHLLTASFNYPISFFILLVPNTFVNVNKTFIGSFLLSMNAIYQNKLCNPYIINFLVGSQSNMGIGYSLSKGAPTPVGIQILDDFLPDNGVRTTGSTLADQEPVLRIYTVLFNQVRNWS